MWYKLKPFANHPRTFCDKIFDISKIDSMLNGKQNKEDKYLENPEKIRVQI